MMRWATEYGGARSIVGSLEGGAEGGVAGAIDRGSGLVQQQCVRLREVGSVETNELALAGSKDDSPPRAPPASIVSKPGGVVCR